MGHPTLRKRARRIRDDEIGTPQLGELITDMIETLDDSGGIGLAAPQVDCGVRLVVLHMPDEPNRYGEFEPVPLTVCLNPTITILDPNDKKGYWEGCLSVPGLRGFVERPQSLRLSYLDPHGEPHTTEFHGFQATLCQHEFDHLDGILYIDRIADSRNLVFEEEFYRFIAPNTEDILED